MTPENTRLLMLSLRRIERSVGYSLIYDFENVAAQLTDAVRIDPADKRKLVFARRTYKAAYMLTRSARAALSISVPPPQVPAARDNDLFLAVVNSPGDLFALATIPNWRERSRFAACYVCEMVGADTPKHLLALLARFDRLYISDFHRVDELARLTGRPCEYLPLAADVFMFAPEMPAAPRPIDVANVGRRAEPVHDGLMAAARDGRIFYYYDSAAASGADGSERTFNFENFSDHRTLYAALLRRTRYLITNRARFNQPSAMPGHEIAGRFYEGAAAGAVLIGDAPDTDEFRRQFGWRDAVIHLPAYAEDPMSLIAALDAQPQRIAEARLRNVRHAALQHDWVYRLAHIFDAFALPHTPAMTARIAQLQTLAQSFQPPSADPVETYQGALH